MNRSIIFVPTITEYATTFHSIHEFSLVNNNSVHRATPSWELCGELGALGGLLQLRNSFHMQTMRRLQQLIEHGNCPRALARTLHSYSAN